MAGGYGTPYRHEGTLFFGLYPIMIFNGLSKELRVSAHLVVTIICIFVVVQDGCFVLYI